MSKFIYLNLQGTVYFAQRRSADDEQMLQLYSSKLRDTTIESIFEAVYSQIALKWHQQDDIVNPFLYARRCHVKTVWIFDIDNDVLRFHKNNHYTWVSLSCLRLNSVTVSDFVPYEPPTAPTQSFPSSAWLSQRTMRRNGICEKRFERHKALVSVMLADFAFQWSVLCGRYNNSTFRKLACAIIRIITLDFNVEEVTTSRLGTGGFLVWLHSLPEWQPFSEDIVRVGGVSIVISQHPRHAITLIRNNFHR